MKTNRRRVPCPGQEGVAFPRMMTVKEAVKAMAKTDTASAMKKGLTECFNRYIRLRDSRLDAGHRVGRCISCGRVLIVCDTYREYGKIRYFNTAHAGHYWPKKNYEALRYDENNVHLQCSHCNNFLEGNRIYYTPALVKKIGQGEVDRLDVRKHNRVEYSRGYFGMMISKYNGLVKGMEREMLC